MRLEVVSGVGFGVVSFLGLVRFRLDAAVAGSAVFRFRLFLTGVGSGSGPGSYEEGEGQIFQLIRKGEKGGIN